jgi:AAT family amino acid transporter
MSEKNNVPSYEKEDLHRGLKSRHIQMIAIGGAIGTGLFYGSKWAIRQAGPAILLTYLIAGIAIYFIMRSLGEMAVEEPVSGSFVSYSNRYIHRYVGFLLGYNPVIFIIAASAAELNALGRYVQYWFPSMPIWMSAIIVVCILFTINMVGVKFYGETEYWFSMIKVVAIVSMIIFGCLMIFFGFANGGHPVGFGNLVNNGGFFPTGFSGFILSIVMAAFAFGGVENLGLAAGEAQDVEKSIPKAVNAVFWRILIFYVGAIFVLVTLYPWNTVGSSGSPFVDVFTKVGIPAAASIINFVVITAAFSSVNSSVFSNSRTLYNLSLQKNAPKFLGKVDKNKVPYAAVITVFVGMLVGVIANILIPEKAFEIFAAITTYGLIASWAGITVSHLNFRKIKIANNEEDKIKFKAPFYPYSNYFSLVFLATVLICIGFIPEMRISLVVAAIWMVIVYIGYKIYTKKEKVDESNRIEA